MRQRGFTLVELMIVIGLIAVIATIAIPNLMAGRMAANEAATIATLRTLGSAQAQYRQTAKADQDLDGSGEYGGFLELSGVTFGRGSTVLYPPVLSGGFRILNGNAEVSRSGYLMKMYLPNGGGAGVTEDPVAGYTAATTQSADMSETTWCCYAWPVTYHGSGSHTFFTNQSGDILMCEVPTYSGTGGGPPPDAAFDTAGTINGTVSLNGPGQNAGGEIWRQAH